MSPAPAARRLFRWRALVVGVACLTVAGIGALVQVSNNDMALEVSPHWPLPPLPHPVVSEGLLLGSVLVAVALIVWWARRRWAEAAAAATLATVVGVAVFGGLTAAASNGTFDHDFLTASAAEHVRVWHKPAYLPADQRSTTSLTAFEA